MSEESLLAHALAYARAGLDVLPLKPGGKKPASAHAKDDATHDLDQVRDWWVQCPEANIGVRPALGTVVVDVDPRDNGATNLVELTRPHGGLTPTWTAYTGGGGLHAWFRATGPFKGKLCTGVDLKHHHNGYVVAPPSLHPSGKRYTWGNTTPIAPAPGWLVALMRRAPITPPARATIFSGGGNTDGLVRVVAEAGGDRHNRLYWAVRRAVEGDRLTDELRARLVRASALDDAEAQRTIECAIVGSVAA